MKLYTELIGKTPRELKEEAEAEISKIKTEKTDESPEKAFMYMLEDERFVKQLYEKFKAFAPSGWLAFERAYLKMEQNC